jgi:two-component system response regulator GlrR
MGECRRILLVDDDGLVLFVLRASLLRMPTPYDVISARDGGEAYRLLQADNFHLLVTDIRLPGIDGVSLTQAARSLAREMAVVWITAHGCAPLREEAVRLGVYCCLEKPVEVSEFRRVVEGALAGGALDNR